MKQRYISNNNRQSQNNTDQIEKDYWQNKLKPLQVFIKSNRTNQQLKLSEQKLGELSDLIDRLLGVRVNFTKTNLSVMEALNLVLSLFINTSEARSKILCTTSGTLRIASYRAKEKLNAHNGMHLVYVLFQKNILINDFIINLSK